MATPVTWKALPLPPDPSSGAVFVVVSPFGAPRTNGPHMGIDLATRDDANKPTTGKPLYAVADGEVRRVDEDDRTGLFVELALEDGSRVLYAHMEGAIVVEGQAVAAGELVGWAGASGLVTGPHLHLQVRDANGKLVDPEPLLLGAAEHELARRADGGNAFLRALGGGSIAGGVLWLLRRRRRRNR